MIRKEPINVLLLENIHSDATEIFQEERMIVRAIPGSLDEHELSRLIQDVHVLGIRSKTKITQKVIDCADKLLVIGAFCIGTNQIDLAACSKKGVAVFNAPYSNTRSVVELVLGEIIMLIRGIFEKSTRLHKGEWSKSASGNHEIRGKRLGIIGYGNIGSQLSVLAEAVGMRVYYYDLVEKLALGNAKKCTTKKELLAKSDIVTVHIDGRKENDKFINASDFQKMKDGVIFLNLSRGFVVDMEALIKNVINGKIGGAAIDVFPDEPKNNNEQFESVLQKFQNVILIQLW